jgi:hypothetical protein
MTITPIRKETTRLIYVATIFPHDQKQTPVDYGVTEAEYRKMLSERPAYEVMDHLISLLRLRRKDGDWIRQESKVNE